MAEPEGSGSASQRVGPNFAGACEAARRGGCCIPSLTMPMMFAGLERLMRDLLEPASHAAALELLAGWQNTPAERTTTLDGLYRQVQELARSTLADVDTGSRGEKRGSQPPADDSTPSTGQYL